MWESLPPPAHVVIFGFTDVVELLAWRIFIVPNVQVCYAACASSYHIHVDPLNPMCSSLISSSFHSSLLCTLSTFLP